MDKPDEHFYSTMAKVVRVYKSEDGHLTVKQDLDKNTLLGQCTRNSLWRYKNCRGKLIKNICNVGVEDLPKLREGNCVMGNKFRLSVDAKAVVCQMKELLVASGVTIN